MSSSAPPWARNLSGRSIALWVALGVMVLSPSSSSSSSSSKIVGILGARLGTEVANELQDSGSDRLGTGSPSWGTSLFSTSKLEFKPKSKSKSKSRSKSTSMMKSPIGPGSQLGPAPPGREVSWEGSRKSKNPPGVPDRSEGIFNVTRISSSESFSGLEGFVEPG